MKIDDDAIAARITAEFPDTAVVYRFGSTASGEEHPSSDVNVAFLPPAPIDPVQRFRLQEELAVLLHRDVDLIDLRNASTVMRMQVLAGGIPIAVLDEGQRGRFEDQVFSSYPRLNEERGAILRDIRERGSVHGGALRG